MIMNYFYSKKNIFKYFHKKILLIFVIFLFIIIQNESVFGNNKNIGNPYTSSKEFNKEVSVLNNLYEEFEKKGELLLKNDSEIVKIYNMIKAGEEFQEKNQVRNFIKKTSEEFSNLSKDERKIFIEYMNICNKLTFYGSIKSEYENIYKEIFISTTKLSQIKTEKDAIKFWEVLKDHIIKNHILLKKQKQEIEQKKMISPDMQKRVFFITCLYNGDVLNLKKKKMNELIDKRLKTLSDKIAIQEKKIDDKLSGWRQYPSKRMKIF